MKNRAHLLVQHGVIGDRGLELLALGDIGQIAVEQEVAGLQEVAVLGELLDGISAIEQNALVAVDIGNGRLTAGGRREAGIIGEDIGVAVETGNVDHRWADRAMVNIELVGVAIEV